ncbi:Lysosomal-trafficking regulator [Habropoda laboriosa]|uniref:Lysosomal-trafficking regulator n=1 Tax=Habropoda laboriosa TaxID=597456 RepID=A0A0L7RDV3_9HYME|nr:Lysosomal-trafficking regulator [Habropoda laboriosa]
MCSGSDPRRIHEDTFYPWFSIDELMSYEEDTRLRTEDREEEDEKEYEERLGMSSASTNKLQILWDHFIHAELQSYEKSSWLDIFLAELLAQVKEGRDVKDALSFCSVGGGGVSTLIACELLSDVHELCAKRINGDQLVGLRKYLAEDRGWRCLAVLQLLGVRSVSCGRELVALLVALYPVAFQEDTNNQARSTVSNESRESTTIANTRNPYVKFYCNDDTVDTVDIVPHVKRKATKFNRNAVSYEGNVPSRRRAARRHSIGTGKVPVHHKQKSFGMFEARRDTPESTSSESELLTDGIDQARSLTLKIRLNPMDFEYFTSVVRSDEEQKWQAALYELPARPAKKTPRDYIDERIKDVLDARISNFETSLLIIQLLQGLRDYDTPAEQTPTVLVLKFALDTLWSLQFGIDGAGLTGTESATLKAAAARLMLTALERVLRANEPTTAVIHYGLLPMTLRLLEDACSKPLNVFSPEEGSLLQEFIFATIYGIITFLYCLLHQQGTAVEQLSDFLELFQLFNESQDGKLLVGAVMKQPCCISSLFVTLTNLLKDSHPFASELQVRLIKVATAAGTCCCFPPRMLMTSIAALLKRHDPATYAPAVALLERILFKELAAYSESEVCPCCDRPTQRSWNFLQIYTVLLTPDDPKLCYTIMAHLLKVGPCSKSHIKRELLVQVFYATFLNAKIYYAADKGNTTAKFLIQSCLTAMSCLIANAQVCEGFTEINGLKEALTFLSDVAFTRNVYALLEITVIVEIWKTRYVESDPVDAEKPALSSLFNSLEKETAELLHIFENTVDSFIEEDYIEQVVSQVPGTKSNEQNVEGRSTVQENTQEERNETEGAINKISCFPQVFDNSEAGELYVETDNEANKNRKINLYQASAAWKAAAGVALCSPKFRTQLSSHPVSKNSLLLFKTLAVCIATDSITDTNKSAHRLFEALLTCCLTSPLCDCDIIMELGKALMDAGIKLGRGLAIIVEALLKVSMLKPAQEETIPQCTRPRLPSMTLEAMPDCVVDDSSTGEYVLADDGYEADVEVPGRSPHSNTVKRSNSLGPVVEPRRNANAHPALCSLAVDLLIYFSEQGLDAEKRSIITAGLRKVAVTCRESASSCAVLAVSGVITKLLDGFRDIFTSRDIQYQDLQHAVLEVFTLLATQSIAPPELVTYLSLFKVDAPPLQSLLEPLFHLVRAARPQPNFILSFPVHSSTRVSLKAQKEKDKNLEKTENLVNNFRKRHLASGICSPWSVHAACLPVGPELAWPVWLQGCSVSMWLRVERGLPVSGKGTLISTSPLLDSDNESLSDWGILSDNWSREVVAGSTSPPTPTSIIHLISIGFESLVLETWLDLRSDKLILRLTRPDDKMNRTISETSVTGMLPSGGWHHLALNFKDTVLNKRSAVVEVVLWVDGWREVNAQLPFDGLLVKKPGTTCVLLGQVGSSTVGAWYLGNLMVFRCPVFTKERAFYLASLGPNYTNLAECILNTEKPDFAPLIASGALDGVREVRFEGGKFDTSRRKSYGGTYLRHAVETKVSETKIDWDVVMDATNSHLGELQDNLLLSYEAQYPEIVHLYPEAVANPAAVVRNLFSAQPGFRVVSAPEHRVSQQPPLSVAPILVARLECQQYRGLVPAVTFVGGVPVFLYLFARVVELNSNEEEQALALSIVL